MGEKPDHPPPQFWLTVIGVFAVYAVTFGSMQAEIRALQDWRHLTQQNRFTSADWRAERAVLIKEIEQERSFARQLCNDLTRLYRELEKFPPNDCARP